MLPTIDSTDWFVTFGGIDSTGLWVHQCLNDLVLASACFCIQLDQPVGNPVSMVSHSQTFAMLALTWKSSQPLASP